MEADSWARFSSKRHQAAALQSRFDLYLGLDEVDGAGEEEARAEFACPFCGDDFDIVGLCCHIEDEHPIDAKNGVCPVCAARVGVDLVGHITTQHGSFFKMQRRRRLRKSSAGSYSTLSLLRKDLREGNLQTLLGASSYISAPSNAAPDPLLSSFIFNLPVADTSKDVQPEPLDEGSVVEKSSDEKVSASVELSLSDEEDRQERARRSEFVQDLLLSTIFEDCP